MAMNQALLVEFDMEYANTRKMLERVPDDKLAWKPHAKSFSMGDLATHIAEVPGWMAVTLEQDSFDVAPSGGQSYQRPKLNSRKEILDAFDKSVAAARATLEKATDDKLMQPWSLLKAGETMFTMPKSAVVRSFLMNHGIHHRAQLGVYLRLNDVPVPGMYGPSADETM
ncbi:MAG: DinB family protein [Acidobacteria bacterium]|nr:DinB family protein [Acidobacteriota bacterium]